MQEYGFSLTRILPYKNSVSENPYSRIFYVVDYFITKLTKLINFCFQNRIFSAELKIADASLISKKISIFPHLSKFLKVLYTNKLKTL